MKHVKKFNEDFETEIEINPTNEVDPGCDDEIKDLIQNLQSKLQNCLNNTEDEDKIELYNQLIGSADDMCGVLGCDNYTDKVGEIGSGEEYNEYPGNEPEEELTVSEVEENKNFIQKAIKHPGALRKELHKKEGQKITKAEINKKISALRKKENRTKAESKELKRLNLAKTLGELRHKKAA